MTDLRDGTGSIRHPVGRKSPLNRGREIGGFPDFRSNQPARETCDSLLLLNSSRNALRLVLRALRPRCLWVPRYICDTVIEAASKERTPVQFYSINDAFLPTLQQALAETEILLYPNYFGIFSEVEKAVVECYGRASVILDRSQALFSTQSMGVAEIRSPRKFLGMPDGGVLRSDIEISPPARRHKATVDSHSHLIGRIEAGSRNWLPQFRKAEHRLGAAEPKRMSRTSEYLLNSANLEWIRNSRIENFNTLHSALGQTNRLRCLFQTVPDGPLCYPFLPEERSKISRAELAEAGIFSAQYWPEVLDRPKLNDFEKKLAQSLLALPCDQRYSREQMNQVIRAVQKIIK